MITFLGSGTSVGVPAIGCGCAVCRSEDARDKRLRCSLRVQTPTASWIVDTGPDLRQQCLRAGIVSVDAVLVSHAHMDHIMGFDDLRRFSRDHEAGLPVYAAAETLRVLEKIFGYAFAPKKRWRGYLYPQGHPIEGPFFLGKTRVQAVPVVHGTVTARGFRFDFEGGTSLAYMSDVKAVEAEGMAILQGVDVLITDALRFRPHPTHMNFEEALALSESLGRPRTFFTHFSCDVSHAEAERDLPSHVALAYDMLSFKL
jgi:phosphoribosyl 1,2-cyclic phosphate phosphodiesterase